MMYTDRKTNSSTSFHNWLRSPLDESPRRIEKRCIPTSLTFWTRSNIRPEDQDTRKLSIKKQAGDMDLEWLSEFIRLEAWRLINGGSYFDYKPWEESWVEDSYITMKPTQSSLTLYPSWSHNHKLRNSLKQSRQNGQAGLLDFGV